MHRPQNIDNRLGSAIQIAGHGLIRVAVVGLKETHTRQDGTTKIRWNLIS